MKNKGFIDLMAIGILVVLAIVGIFFIYPAVTGKKVIIPFFSKEEGAGFSFKCIRKDDAGNYFVDEGCDGVENGLSIVGTTEGVYGIGFTLSVQNTGWSGTPKPYDTVTLSTKSNNIGTLDFSGDLYEAFKNGGTLPEVKTNVAPSGTVTWDSTLGSCDSSEVSILSSCWIPTDLAIGGHNAYDTICSPGSCSWGVEAQASYTYGGKTKTVTGSNSASAIIKQDPVAGIVVQLIQRT